jgi:magnesium-transporting ATPase (P-type)
MKWYSLETEEVFEKLETSPKGLSEKEAERRLEKYGSNDLHRGNYNEGPLESECYAH